MYDVNQREIFASERKLSRTYDYRERITRRYNKNNVGKVSSYGDLQGRRLRTRAAWKIGVIFCQNRVDLTSIPAKEV